MIYSEGGQVLIEKYENANMSTPKPVRLYNFLDSKLLPKITTDAQCTEDHGIENLISENFLVRSRGFVADTTTRAPIYVDIELICPINVHYIVLAKNLNHQYYTTIEVQTKYKSTFTPVAYERFNTSGVVFYNSHLYSPEKLPSHIDASYKVAFFKPHKLRAFSVVDFVRLNVMKVERSVPCLGRLEVWGTISRVCPDETTKTVDYLMGLSSSTSVQNVEAAAVSDDSFKIPDDFKDSLTFEVMALPVTLPSGNTVDQTTLDKWIETEASYGRSGSDPFTAQQFTNIRKPVFNAALKHRIDMFLLQNAHRKETFGLQRTVGRSTMKRKAEPDYGHTVSENNSELSSEDVLSMAIKRTVNSKGFIRFTSNNESAPSNNKPECVKCKVSNNLYVISCDHHYCKNCLLSICSKLKCVRCDATFSKSEAKKVH